MEIDDEKYTDEDLGICIADEECMKMEQFIKNVGRFLIISVPVIVCGLILLMVKSIAT